LQHGFGFSQTKITTRLSFLIMFRKATTASLVVKDLNLSIGKGEFLTMLGPSGSGKTTCLMMLAGFETATNGEILLDGRPINQVPPHKRGIGMVFQNYALFPHMTVGENLSFPLEVRGMGKSSARRRSSARWTWCRWGPLPTAARRSFRAGSSSASRWPGRWSLIPAWC
jgi:ABC-type nitrate/sulfonate/bicarbonate transport system ATPase subunit